MGFYGNITSTNKTQFTFDKIYPNRKTMDKALEIYATEGDTSAPGDGVFIGRFVLVDYEDGNLIPSTYYPIFKQTIEETNVFYADSSFETIMTTDLCKKNQVFQYQSGSTFELWRATGESATIKIDETEVQYATFVKIEQDEKGDPVEKYLFNYNEDMELYGAGRGYDGTVWQKVFAEGKEKYVMVAELNSVVPTFKVTADAPTMNPLPPHFDKQSNNVAYWLHVQPQWGMRVKQAEPLKDADQQVITDKDGNPIIYSDTEVTWVETPYDEVTNELKEPITTQVPGNIYFNKAGLSKEVRTYNQMDDVVSIAPTGTSGYLYPGHTAEPKEANDIQEISIILPSIGNAISDAWDVVYGVPKAADNKRNLDIDWDSLKGIRMVEEGGSGYRYNSTNANSLAGCINSVHDLMGMIIMEESVADAKDADTNSIYYNSSTKKFERKHTTYEYEIVHSVNNDNTFEEKPGANLLKWVPGKYYYKDSLKNYFVDSSDKPDKSRNYYNPDFKDQVVTPKYLPETWWTKSGSDYLKDRAGEERETIYYNIESAQITAYWYRPGEYFYKTKTEDLHYLVASESTLNTGYIYYRLKKGSTPGNYYKISELENQTITYEEEPGKYVTITTKVIPSDATFEKITLWTEDKTFGLVQFEQNKFYDKEYGANHDLQKNPGDYDLFLLTSAPMDNDGVWSYSNIIKKVEVVDPIYKSDTYYYKSNKDYLKDRAGEFDENKEYCTLISEGLIEKEFYLQGEYYEKSNGEYNESTDSDPNTDKNYYEKKGYYVIEDKLGVLPVGYEWDPEIKTWDENILTIGTRKEIYKMQELPGFARSFNTIHGLILEIKKLLDTGHALTRDQNTVQGSLNKLNDIIAKFGKMKPAEVVVVDEYGRFHSAVTTEDAWVNYRVVDDAVNPTVGVVHNAAQAAVSRIAQANVAPKFGEKITTAKMGIDEKGHVAELETEEVALPKPSLTNNGSGVVTEMSLVDVDGALTATYTSLSDVKLDGYGKTTATGAIVATDSLEVGLSKLENNIDNNAAAIRAELATADAKIREDFAAEDAAIRSELAAVDTAIRTDFAAADAILQNNIDNVNTSLGNRITTIENKGDFGVGALTTRVETNENKLAGIDTTVVDSITNAVSELSTGQVETNKGAIEGLDTRVSTVETTLKDVPSVGAALESTHQRIEGVENRVSVIEDQFKNSDIAEDGTETPRTYGILKWYNQEFMPDTPNREVTLWFDTTTGEIKLYNGLMWVVLSATAVA